MAERPAQSNKDIATEDPEKSSSLNFKVTLEFKKAFKGYAVSRGISMVDLLKEGFELSKARHSR